MTKDEGSRIALLEQRVAVLGDIEAAENSLARINEQLAASMPEAHRDACAAALRWLHLRDGDRGAAGACFEVVRVLAPWLAEIATEDISGAYYLVDPPEEEHRSGGPKEGT